MTASKTAAKKGSRSASTTASTTAPISNDAVIVPVALGPRSYEIVIGRGVVGTLGTRIAGLRPGAKAFIVTDDNVARLALPAAQASLKRAGVSADQLVVPPGEVSKSYATFERLCEAIVDAQIERGDLVVALGGGVIGDLAGFAAAVVRRGLDYVQVPTTLLAQVDSSVGGKTAIDSRQGKNLIGAFHQPSLVIADTALLDTLPEREFRAGYAELVKYSLLGDAAFFAWLEAHWREIFAAGVSANSAREHAVAVACRAKAAIVGRDERETGERALLNLGHTFGHALEAAYGFSDRLLHGEAIAIGMMLAFEFSAGRGLLPMAEAERVKRHLAEVGLPTKPSEIPGPLPGLDRIMELIAQDKKVKRGMLTLILVRAIGSAFIEAGIDEREIRDFLSEKLVRR
jgi:3-dehydroquinate synthase